MNCGQWVSTAGVNGNLSIVLRSVLPGGAKGTRTPDPLLAKIVGQVLRTRSLQVRKPVVCPRVTVINR